MPLRIERHAAQAAGAHQVLPRRWRIAEFAARTRPSAARAAQSESIASSCFSRRAASSRSQAASDVEHAARRGRATTRVSPPVGQRVRRQRPQPDVGPFAFLLRARGLRGALEPLGGLCVVAVAVVDEADVVRILPAIRAARAIPFSSSRIARSDRPGSARLLLREEERAEPVGDVEVRIERRRQIEQRIQQLVRLVGTAPTGAFRRNAEWRGSSTGPPRVASYDSASRVSTAGELTYRICCAGSGCRKPPLAHHLQRYDRRHQHGDGDDAGSDPSIAPLTRHST